MRSRGHPEVKIRSEFLLRSHSYLSLRATYTVGSMAGLGFSMAVVGLSIGIFVGFILWKGRLGLPYYYCSTR